jgi:hypothetical protein
LKVLLYFADGFAWQYWREADFMSDFWPAHRPLETLLGYSSTVMPSMLSGKYPRDTGIWTEYYYEPRPRTRLERILTASRAVLMPANMLRLILFRIARKRGSPSAHLLRIPLQFAHLFKRHPLDYRDFPPMQLSVPSLDQVFKEHGLRLDVRYLEGSPDTAREIAYLRAHRDDVDVFFFHDHSIDAKGHHVGASTARMKPEMDHIATFLREAWGLLNETDDCEMILFSDHGMTDVRATYDLLHALRDLRLGEEYHLFIDSTFARFWFPNPAQRQRVMDLLADAPGRFLTAEEMRASGLDFDDDRYGQETMVADEGVVFHPSYISPSFFRTRQYPDKGTHGYWPAFPSSYGVFAYRGRRWHEALPDPVPAVDLFTVVSGIVEAAVPAARESATTELEEVCIRERPGGGNCPPA